MHPLGERLQTFGVNWLEVLRRLILIAFPLKLLQVALAPDNPVLGGDLISIVSFVLVTFIPLYLYVSSPRLIVYTLGIGRVQNGVEQTWRWEQITGMDGVRTTHALYGVIPIMGYGANKFYSGEDHIFSVSMLTARANDLVAYIFSYMAVPQVTTVISLYRDGKTINFGNFQVSKTGLGNQREWFDWHDIAAVSYRGDTVKILRESTGKKRSLGELKNVSIYVLMGLLDHIRRTDSLQVRRQQTLKQPVYVNLFYKAVITVYALGLAFFFYPTNTATSSNTVAPSDVAVIPQSDPLVDLLGSNATNLCYTNASQNGSLPANPNHFVVIDVDHNELYLPFHYALDESQRAVSRQDTTVIACVQLQVVHAETCYYGSNDTSVKTFPFTVNRYRQDANVWLIDMQTQQRIAQTTLRGYVPPECPDRANRESADLYGAMPDSQVFLDWLQELDSTDDAMIAVDSWS